MSSIMKVWRLTPEQVANYRLGQDLGKPNELINPHTKIDKQRIEKQKQRIMVASVAAKETRIKNGRGKKTGQEYIELRNQGMTDEEIADAFGIKFHSLKVYISAWRRGGCKI